MSEAIYDAACEVRGAITELKIGIESAIERMTATIADRADQLMDVLSTPPITFKEKPRRMIRLGTDTIVDVDAVQVARFCNFVEDEPTITIHLIGRAPFTVNATSDQFRTLTEAMEGKPDGDGPRYYLIDQKSFQSDTLVITRHETPRTIVEQVKGRDLDDFEVLVDDAKGVRLIDLAGNDPTEIPALLS